jgi:hypothetical protein
MGSKKQSSEQRWHEQAEAYKREAEKLPYGRAREELLRKARQLETASRINEWVSSPGLSSPKWIVSLGSSAKPSLVYFDQRPGLNKFPGRPSYQLASNNGCLGTRFGGFPMCDKCSERDKKIEHYRQMLLSIWRSDHGWTDQGADRRFAGAKSGTSSWAKAVGRASYTAEAMKRPGRFLSARASPSRQISLVYGANQIIAYAADNDDGRDGPKQ